VLGQDVGFSEDFGLGGKEWEPRIDGLFRISDRQRLIFNYFKYDKDRRETLNDGISFAYDQYLVGTLTVTKLAAVISDGFTTNPANAKAIPGAIVEYTITVHNDGLVTSAATLTEVIPTNTTYVAGSTTLNGAAVADVAGAMPYVNPAAISSPGQAAGVILANTTPAQRAVVKFRVTIN